MLVALSLAACDGGRTSDALRKSVGRAVKKAVTAKRPPAPLAGADAITRGWMRKFYAARSYAPVWVNGTAGRDAAKKLHDVLVHADERGLDPADYEVERIAALLDSTQAAPFGPAKRTAPFVELELLLTREFFQYASDVTQGRLRSPDLGTAERRVRARRSMVPLLERVAKGEDTDDVLASAEPAHPGYRRLLEAYARYRTLLADGGWPRVGPGPDLAPGSRSARVDALRTRLSKSGEYTGDGRKGRAFDANLTQAVRTFQAHAGLPVTGRVSKADVAELDRGVEERVRQIALNLERWRWLPSDLGERHVLVNIPEYRLRVLDGESSALEMRVVVGKEFSPTPVFSDTLTYIVFGPSWGIPESIANGELLPSARSDPASLTRRHIVVTAGGNDTASIDPADIDWDKVESGEAHYSLRQEPGPDNPLGRIKFMCPNQFNVYLHDTPAGHLFGRGERGFSHGCVRLEDPTALAVLLLDDPQKWDAAHVTAAMDSSHDRTVRLPHPTPVHLVYWTAWVDPDGALEFRDDVYGIDQASAARLSGYDTAPPAVRTRPVAPSRVGPS